VLGAVGALLLTALLTLLIARWWRRRPRREPPPAPPRPAWEIAVEKLEALRRDRRAAISEGRVEEWIDGLSDALREYFGHRYGFDGLESTTDEVLGHLRNERLHGTSVSEVAAVLGECDLVKFARATLDESRCDALLEEAFRIVKHTARAAAAAGVGPPVDAAASGSGPQQQSSTGPSGPQQQGTAGAQERSEEGAAPASPTAPETASPTAPEADHSDHEPTEPRREDRSQPGPGGTP
jgi:hypothetical protein